MISAVAPLLSSLDHFVGEKLGDKKIAQSVAEYIVQDAKEAHARVGQINKVWQAILSSGGGEMKVVQVQGRGAQTRSCGRGRRAVV